VNETARMVVWSHDMYFAIRCSERWTC